MNGILKQFDNIISIDAETDGLYGLPFAIGVTVYDNEGVLLDTKSFRLPDSVVSDIWVKENILPNIDIDIDYTSDGFDAMMCDFRNFFAANFNPDRSLVIHHMGFITESFLFRILVDRGMLGRFSTPYHQLDVYSLLLLLGEKADSVDTYIAKYDLITNIKGKTHNPLYDADVAATVMFNALRRLGK